MKILFITLEFDQYITGGIGRVVNSLVPTLGIKLELQIILIKDVNHIFKSIRLFQRENNQWNEKKYLHFGYRMLVDLINTEKYNAVHLFYAENKTAAVARLIKKRFPSLPVIYSCHSLIKYEKAIRSNYPSMLKHENIIIHNIDYLHLLNWTSLKYFQAAYPAATGQIPYSIIPNGIAEESFQKKDAQFELKMKQAFY
ncbi:MAG TPA: hypothetical protein VHY08_27060, partial [Bacillota bacterium]|nr:hypothetical protein [Bacillota bacterium]